MEPNATAPFPDRDPTGHDTILNWDALSPAPDKVNIFFDKAYTESGLDYSATLAGSAITHTIPHTAVDDETVGLVKMYVRTINQITLSGNNLEAASVFEALNFDIVTISFAL